uniref:Cytochrome c oxidase subunit 3 n=1 Tax=Diaphorencyrtus aligarhensis TaxID=436678 RepID=A0A6C0M853_9HYME|nr:cytochrome c oxidase subunit III [Diaphorencyrtus aligarhensis]QHU77267.1 cytochrome c oxidase subunit III [Diaphorencyrtus aligarhensis]
MWKLLQPFHLVSVSPWPILMSLSAMNLMVSFVWWFFKGESLSIFFMILILLNCMFFWWRDVVRESFFQGFHTDMVVNGLKLGMILFIISEIFFFISIFWCYFHMFLSPSIEIGVLWPPKNIQSFNPYSIPLLNTVILLSSGVTITWCHYSMLNSNKKSSIFALFLTISLGLVFSLFQLFEYSSASFTFSDSVYGSIFFMSTGFHGLHVLIGTMFLMVNFIRMLLMNFSSTHHFGFEAAAWYWHFVDVVWLFLYLLVYFWPAN